MSNLIAITHQGGSAHRNLGVAAAAYAQGEIIPDGDDGFLVYDCGSVIGKEAAAALPDGGTVYLVPNPTYDPAEVSPSEQYGVDEAVYAEPATPASAYNYTTNPYANVVKTSATNERYLGRVERSATEHDEYIQIRIFRAVIAGA